MGWSDDEVVSESFDIGGVPWVVGPGGGGGCWLMAGGDVGYGGGLLAMLVGVGCWGIGLRGRWWCWCVGSLESMVGWFHVGWIGGLMIVVGG